ncbi:MAG: sigma-70 family RNA polymerase sigma factor [Gammaproteobacteria bacterium]|nr:sigma-70 family RNA polymerase sigma factor [Gammaproteobacteria bacterium]MBU1350264.1 sigma-70 family RNA polymerase sigma factor [Gammaproteobacteria bacterium]MBU1508035.1 sigma-70 family RNA polymerase sigma factor [Gammaproteobacteria bacterium]MBU2120954.1 sigma-70 family RNA polymerase sigma factor [Gammaproteobacteria bacterium]MBU2171168.1 sigma-70 family RNA polymerase sigma factor [Gammaproteobacteria bacterium]
MRASHNARVRNTPSSEDADETLMLRYAGGDLGAFDTLYGRHELAVWRFVFRSVKVQAVADDLLQDVWFAVARNAHSYEVKAKFRTWLFTLAHHRLVDHVRTAKNHSSLDASDDDERSLADTLAADSGFGPVRQLQSREQAAALIAAVEQLPLEQREAFLLQAEGDLSVHEIAEATGVHFETAKSRLRYARASLRQHLKEFAP